MTEICITKPDLERIRKILNETSKEKSSPDKVFKQKLEHELTRACVVESQNVPQNVITMNSRVSLLLNNEEELEVSLVYPEEADLSSMKISVFSPIGTAILGYREGSAVEWDVPSGKSVIQIKKVLYQPEAAGDYHL